MLMNEIEKWKQSDSVSMIKVAPNTPQHSHNNSSNSNHNCQHIANQNTTEWEKNKMK